MVGDIRDEWRIRDVERKAQQAIDRLYELDSLRSKLDSMERTNRELSTCVDGLRATVETCLEKIDRLEEIEDCERVKEAEKELGWDRNG